MATKARAAIHNGIIEILQLWLSSVLRLCRQQISTVVSPFSAYRKSNVRKIASVMTRIGGKTGMATFFSKVRRKAKLFGWKQSALRPCASQVLF